ncbi:MAG: DUF2911 domain-containing protein [Bacteroidota bacterium]
MFKFKTLSILLLAGALFTLDVAAQDLHESRRLSPLGMARAFVGDTYVKVTYGQPYMRGRDNIFGEDGAMHPNGKVWRFGANEPTELTLGGDLKVGDAVVPAGTYSIFATPGADSWMVHINDFRGGGAGGYKADNNVASFEVPAMTKEEDRDQFGIALEEVEGGLHMVAGWTNWEIRVPIMPAN